MGFLAEAGAIEIGQARATNKYMFSQVRDTNRLYCVFIGAKGTGEVWESRNEGLVWQQIDDVGPVTSITVRGRYYAYCRVTDGYAKAGVRDTRTGNTVAEVPLAQGTWRGSMVLPVPEISSNVVMAQFQERFGSQWYFHTLDLGGAPFGRVPGDRMFAMWGPEEAEGGPSTPVLCIWEYVDRFWEATRYACWGVYNVQSGGWTIDRSPYHNTPIAHTYENDIHGSGYEGFLNARAGWEGVGKQEGNPSPSFFLPPDHWQGNMNNSAPMWIPNLKSKEPNLKFPIASTPNGLTEDSGSSRGAVMGWVGGRRTFGMIEPGYGFAHCTALGYYVKPDVAPDFSSGGDSGPDRPAEFAATFDHRKFIGNLGLAFTRTTMWMPYSSGIFGLGVGAYMGNPGLQTVFWVYDKKPLSIPTAVQVENGVYTDRDDKQTPQARRGEGAYYRW